MADSDYYTEMVCESGHVITDCLERSSRGSEYCDECGAKNITSCPSCGAKIRGDLIDSGVISIGFQPEAPKYCHRCGYPYPWTRSAIDAVKELAELDDRLTEEDAEALGLAVADSMNDNPKTKVAVVRIKKIFGKAGKATADAMRDIVVDVASEAAKKMLVG